MKSKERGFVLSVDPASNKCGVSLWHDGVYLASACLSSRSSTDPFSIRMQTIVRQLENFLILELPADQNVTTIITEGVRSRLLQTCVGSLIVVSSIKADISPKTTFVEPKQWKSWAKKHGATTEPIKGLDALREVGWDMVKFPIGGHDEADSILIYLAWRDRI